MWQCQRPGGGFWAGGGQEVLAKPNATRPRVRVGCGVVPCSVGGRQYAGRRERWSEAGRGAGRRPGGWPEGARAQHSRAPGRQRVGGRGSCARHSARLSNRGVSLKRTPRLGLETALSNDTAVGNSAGLSPGLACRNASCDQCATSEEAIGGQRKIQRPLV